MASSQQANQRQTVEMTDLSIFRLPDSDGAPAGVGGLSRAQTRPDAKDSQEQGIHKDLPKRKAIS